MSPPNDFAVALALLDDLARHGAHVALGDAGELVVTGVPPPDALLNRLALLGASGARGTLRYRALVAELQAPSRAAREVLTLPVTYAVGLPVPFTVVWHRVGLCIVTTTSRARYAAALAAGETPFVLRELVLAVEAVAAGRAGPAELDSWLALKAQQPGVVLDRAVVVGLPEARAPVEVLMCFGELFDALGAELVEVEMHDAAQVGSGPDRLATHRRPRGYPPLVGSSEPATNGDADDGHHQSERHG